MTKLVIAAMLGVWATGASAQSCTAVVFAPGESGAYVQGVVAPEGVDCYTLAVRSGQNIFIEVVVGDDNVAVSVPGVNDAQRTYDFTAQSTEVEFRVIQMFRSPRSEDYALLVQVQ